MDIFEFRRREESGVDPETEDLAQQVIGAAIEVHRELGPGLPEVAYRNALSYELTLRGIEHECEVPFEVMFKGRVVCEGRLDILVRKRLVLELKSVEHLTGVHSGQASGYLKSVHLQLALLINFNVMVLKDGIKRVVNTRQ